MRLRLCTLHPDYSESDICTPNNRSRQLFVRAFGLMLVSTDNRARKSHRSKTSSPSGCHLEKVTAQTTPSASISLAKKLFSAGRKSRLY